MKKRLCILLSAIMMFLSVTTNHVNALGTSKANVTSSGECGDNANWTLYDDGTLVVEGTGTMDDYSYPNYSPWYSSVDSINKVLIKEGITHIGNYSFLGGTIIQSVELPSTLKSIGDSAFETCYELNNIALPNGLTTIGEYAFAYCESIESMFIPSSVIDINSRAFSSCSSLRTLTLSDGLKSIGDGAFLECDQLEYIIIPGTVEYLGVFSFDGCDNVSSIIFKEGIKSITYGCDDIDYYDGTIHVYVPSTVMSIEDYSFYYLTKNKNTIFYVQKNSYAHHFFEEKGYDYKLIRPNSFDIVNKDLGLYVNGLCEVEVSFNEEGDNRFFCSSDNPTVVAIDKNGILHGISEGTANITVMNMTGAVKTCKATVYDLGILIYTGNVLNPNLKITKNNQKLQENVDYTISYSDLINAGVHTATITYPDKSKEVRKYVIHPKNINSLDTIVSMGNPKYNGAPQEFVTKVTDGDTVLKEGKDYKVFYYDNVTIGKATARIVGLGNYTGIKECSREITKVNKIEYTTLDEIYVRGIPNTHRNVKINDSIKFVYQEVYLSKFTNFKVYYNGVEQSASPTLSITVNFDKPGEWVLEANYTEATTEKKYVNGVLTTVVVHKPTYKRFPFTCYSDIPVSPSEMTSNLPVEVDYETLAFSYDTDFSVSNLSDATWSTSNKSIATVDKGLVTILKPGRFNVFASIGSQEVKWDMEIDALDLSSAGSIDNFYMHNDTKMTLVRFNKYLLEEGKDYVTTYTYVSNDYIVVKVTGKGLFTGTIEKVYHTDTCYEYDMNNESLTLSSDSISLYPNTTHQLLAIVKSIYPDKLTWKSNNKNIADVDQNGIVTAKTVGMTTITVSTSHGLTASCEVIVKEKVFPFTDVKKSKWYYNVVKQAYEAGLMSGTGETTFSPEDNMTRGMIVTVLHRIAGKPNVTYTGKFKDVSRSSYCATAVEWAAKNKVVSGYSNGKFGPNDNITRQDVAVILYNYARTLGLDVKNNTDLSKFKDYKNVSAYAKPAMQWAVSVGILSGSTKDGKTYLNPKDNASRAECAKMLLVASKIYK